MRYALYDNNGYIKGSGYSNQDDADRIANENDWSVIETGDFAIDSATVVVDTGIIRTATPTEQSAHPTKVLAAARNVIKARLRDDRDNGARSSMPQLAQSRDDMLKLMNLEDG